MVSIDYVKGQISLTLAGHLLKSQIMFNKLRVENLSTDLTDGRTTFNLIK